MDDPMISTYSRSMTSDPLMTSSILGGCLGGPASHSLGGPASLREPASLGGPNSVRDTASAMAALSSSPPKNYGIGSGLRGSDEWSDATWLNNLRISAGMDPIPMPSSTSVQASKVGCFKKILSCDLTSFLKCPKPINYPFANEILLYIYT